MACGYRAAGPGCCSLIEPYGKSVIAFQNPFKLCRRYGGLSGLVNVNANPGAGRLLLAPAAGHQSTTAHGLVADAP